MFCQNVSRDLVPGDGNFKAISYEGTGASSNAITGLGFEPNLIMIFCMTAGYGNYMFDSLRGAGNSLLMEENAAENTATAQLTSFDSDGFTVPASANTNASGRTYVALCWRLGQTATDEIYSESCGVSVKIFSGNSTAGRQLSHSLPGEIKAAIVKNRSTTTNWATFFDYTNGELYREYINVADARSTTDFWHDTQPTDSVLYLGDEQTVNQTAYNYVAVMFCDVDGATKYGNYTGNASTTGPDEDSIGIDVHALLIKGRTSSDGWALFMEERTDPQMYYYTRLDDDLAEQSLTGGIDRSSGTGFVVESSENIVNRNSVEHDYLVFAKVG